MRAALPFTKFIKEGRNSAEHRKPNQRIEAQDFVLRETGELVPSSIEAIHPTSAQASIPVHHFMVQIIDQISVLFELMVTHMCEKHVAQLAGFELHAHELEESKRSLQHVRFCYGISDGTQVIPIG
jgi:hypothetical protein